MDDSIATGDLTRAQKVFDEISAWSRGETTPQLRAEIARTSGRLAAARGDHEEAQASLAEAIEMHRRIGDPWFLARPLVELAEDLLAEGRPNEAEPLLAEAREIFERLGVRPWLDRLDRIQGSTLRVASEV